MTKRLLLVDGGKAQPLWDELFKMMPILKDALLSCDISCKAIIARHLESPNLELQHCVLLDRQGESSLLSYAFAYAQFSLPYQFQPVDGCGFQPNCLETEEVQHLMRIIRCIGCMCGCPEMDETSSASGNLAMQKQIPVGSGSDSKYYECVL